jgi:hypothetical protein
VDQLPEGTHRRSAYRDRLGRSYPETIRRNPGRRREVTSTALPPPAPPRRGRRLTISATVTAAAVGVALTLNASLGGSSAAGDSLTVQVKVDLTQAISGLAKLGFLKTQGRNLSGPSYGTDCAAVATGGVQQFLKRYRCKEYAISILTAHRQGTGTEVAISWVVMPTTAQATQYRSKADSFGQGNPPGEPRTIFDGHCYASGQNGLTVWAEQVQPTGDVNVDREILQSAVPSKVTPAYLRQHCDR